MPVVQGADVGHGDRQVVQAGVPLVPCVIWGSQRIWTKDLPKHFRDVPVIVRYGEPVALTGDAEADTAELKRQMQLLLDASRSEYASLYTDGAGEAWMPVALGGTAQLIRIMRANLLDELRRPYVVTARAKGLSEKRVILKYPVRAALNPFASTVA